MRKIIGPDAGQLYAMKVLKKASLKGRLPLHDEEVAFINLAFTFKNTCTCSLIVFPLKARAPLSGYSSSELCIMMLVY